METYKPWDFCRSINCNSMIRSEEMRKELICPNCKAYQMHDYLREKGSIIEEDSKLPKQIEWLKSEVNRLQVALDATIAEKERCRELAVEYSMKADGYKASLEMCQNLKLAREFEELLQTTSIPVAVENLQNLIITLATYKRALELACQCAIDPEEVMKMWLSQAKEVAK